MQLINKIKKELKNLNCESITLKNKYHYFSGFFNFWGEWYYISSGDDRLQQKKFMIRTAKDNKDYSGGFNHFINYEKENFDLIGDNIQKFIKVKCI